MRISPVCHYISTQLNTIVSLYSPDSFLLEQYLPGEGFSDFFSPYPAILAFLIETAAEDYPVLSFINEYMSYVSFKTDEGIYIIGPFHLLFSEEGMYAQHKLTIEEIEQEALAKIPAAYPPFALKYILLLFNSCQQQDLTEAEYFQQNFQTEFIRQEATAQTVSSIFSNRENQKMHNPYDQEIRLLKCIEEGDIEKLKQTWSEPITGELGTTAADPVRNGKNMAIYNVTASGRAAIRGGLSAEYVFSLTDSYCQQIEGLKNMLLLQSLVQDAEMNFAQMVVDQRRGKQNELKREHPLIHQCKNYVFQHLHSKLSVQEIAKELHVHPNFLSSLFHNHEGIPLYQYILLQKIDLTKNLLVYSDYSYIDIANYLGFTSQSHLGIRFKAITGMTLKQYRDTYKKEEFS